MVMMMMCKEHRVIIELDEGLHNFKIVGCIEDKKSIFLSHHPLKFYSPFFFLLINLCLQKKIILIMKIVVDVQNMLLNKKKYPTTSS